MREKHVLSSIIQSKDAYTSIVNHVERGDFSEQGWIIWKCISAYYDTDADAQRIDGPILADSVARSVSADKHKTIFQELVKDLASFETSPANVVDDLLATKREVKAHELANALLQGHDVEALMQEYDTLVVKTSFDEEGGTEVRQGHSVATLCTDGFNPEGLIQVWPPSLNQRLDVFSCQHQVHCIHILSGGRQKEWRRTGQIEHRQARETQMRRRVIHSCIRVRAFGQQRVCEPVHVAAAQRFAWVALILVKNQILFRIIEELQLLVTQHG